MKIRAFLLLVLLCTGLNSVFAEAQDAEEAHLERVVSLYYGGTNSYEFYKAINNYRHYLLAKQRMREYYASWEKEINYDIHHNHFRNALKKTELLEGELKADKAEKYYYLVDYLMGVFYGMREDNPLAKRHLLQAVKLADPEQDQRVLLTIYQTLANISIFKHLEEGLDGYGWADKAVSISKSAEERCASMALKAMVAFGHTDKATFEKCSAEIDRLLRENPDMEFKQYSKYVRIGRATYAGDYEKAIQICDSILDEVGRYYFMVTVYEIKGDVQAERDVLIKLLKAKDHRNNEISSLTVNDINQDLQIEQERIAAQKAQQHASITIIVIIALAVVLSLLIIYLIVRYLRHHK